MCTILSHTKSRDTLQPVNRAYLRQFEAEHIKINTAVLQEIL